MLPCYQSWLRDVIAAGVSILQPWGDEWGAVHDPGWVATIVGGSVPALGVHVGTCGGVGRGARTRDTVQGQGGWG